MVKQGQVYREKTGTGYFVILNPDAGHGYSDVIESLDPGFRIIRAYGTKRIHDDDQVVSIMDEGKVNILIERMKMI